MKKTTLIVALAIQLLALRSTRADTYIGFGDSIVLGGSWPILPITTFDCVPGCGMANSTQRDQCSFAQRVENGVSGSVVKNRGWGAETTAGGMSRIDGELAAACGTPGVCNAVILMHGSNDLFNGLSLPTAKTNIGIMMNKAEARHIDVLLSTAIRRVFDPGNSSWITHRANIENLASTRHVQLADPHPTLCPGDTCYRRNYYVSTSDGPTVCPGANEDTYGHLDPDGYDILSPLIEAEIEAFPVPAVPNPTSPSGTISDDTPTYSWPNVANARWYHFQVDTSGATEDEWYKEVDICPGGTCSVTPAAALSAGAHTWRVSARNLRGNSNPSAYESFTVGSPPGIPIATSPNEDVLYGNPVVNQTFTWTEATDADNYEMEITGFAVEVKDTSGCAGTCTKTTTNDLAGGNHSWKVRATNTFGASPWSATLGFTVVDSPPAPFVPLYPAWETFDDTLTYEWTPSAGAASYEFKIDSGVDPATVTCGSTCTATPAGALSIGVHDWEVKASNIFGDTTIGPTSFEVFDCASYPDLDLPTEMVIADQTVRACGQIEAGQLGPYMITGSEVDVDFHAGDQIIIYDGFSVEDGATFTAMVDKN